MDSILTTIKTMLGIVATATEFDQILITHINSVFAILQQLGVGPKNGFAITGSGETWSNFISGDPYTLRDVKTYIYLKVKLMFDPPQNSAVLTSYTNLCSEFEFRLNVAVDPKED